MAHVRDLGLALEDSKVVDERFQCFCFMTTDSADLIKRDGQMVLVDAGGVCQSIED